MRLYCCFISIKNEKSLAFNLFVSALMIIKGITKMVWFLYVFVWLRDLQMRPNSVVVVKINICPFASQQWSWCSCFMAESTRKLYAAAIFVLFVKHFRHNTFKNLFYLFIYFYFRDFFYRNCYWNRRIKWGEVLSLWY